jgi:hypothetical protein
MLHQKGLFIFSIIFSILLFSCNPKQESEQPTTEIIEEEKTTIPPKSETNISSDANEQREGLKSSHIGEYKKGTNYLTKKGKLISASEDTGLPYTHYFEVVLENGDTTTFDFFGGEFSAEFIGYEGLNCVIDYSATKDHTIEKWFDKNSEGKFEEEQDKDADLDYLNYPSITGIYSAPHLSGDLPTEFYVKNDKETVTFIDFIEEAVKEEEKKEVKVYYSTSIRNNAVRVVFPSLKK